MPKGCFPSQATIASFAGVTDRTVRNSLSKLKNMGWISWTNTRLGRRQSVNRYIFTLSRQIIHAVLSGIEKFKAKTAEIRDLFRRKNVPPSASFIFNNRRTSMNSTVRSVAKKILNEAQGLDEDLSNFQRLSKEEMMKQLRALS
ncbi:helix-turn-helix domain-containing protein (plasmid) [Acetobacteraceae bacterium]|nr:helix-turn-helix domain-containing protein [Acetobacteraceae bacterium]QCE35854.1 helix-turn-helix domain-containing protein [Acetobacteraceae bacterium]